MTLLPLSPISKNVVNVQHVPKASQFTLIPPQKRDDGISESHPSKNQLRFGGDGDADDSDDNDDADDSDSMSLSLKCHSTSNRKEDGSDDSDSMSLNKKPASNSTKNKKSVKRAKLDIFSPMYGDAGKRSSTSAKSRTSKESKAEEGGSVKSPASKERRGASAMSGAGGGAMPPSSTTRSGDGNNPFEVINLEDEVRSDEGNSIKNNPFEVINLADEVSSDEGNKIFSVYTQVKDESRAKCILILMFACQHQMLTDSLKIWVMGGVNIFISDDATVHSITPKLPRLKR